MNAITEDSRRVAGLLLDAGCVEVRGEEPFRLPSGWASPVYMDCRRLGSFPAIRRDLVATGLAQLRAAGRLEGLGAVVGAETSGIALAAWMADTLDLPLLVVRKQPTAQAPVEGVLAAGTTVLLVDDMMAAGHSKRRFAQALAQAGAVVRDVFVVFDYGTFPTGALLAPLGVATHALCDWRAVLAVASERGMFDAPALAEVQRFLQNPAGWSQAHGGIAAPPADRSPI